VGVFDVTRPDRKRGIRRKTADLAVVDAETALCRRWHIDCDNLQSSAPQRFRGSGDTTGATIMNQHHADPEPWYRSRLNLAFCGFVAVAAVFLLTEHWAHVVPVLPWLLLLLCPLMHLFGHGGHGGHGGHVNHEGHDPAETEGGQR
jgi:hypothetical protein